MKSKTYKSNKGTCKTYMKSVGQGWECTVVLNGRSVFVGNFVHQKEATKWWTVLNTEIKNFGKKYPVGNKLPTNWYTHFISNYLYKTYYTYLDKNFAQYNKEFKKAVASDVKKYQRLNKNWYSHEKTPFFKAA